MGRWPDGAQDRLQGAAIELFAEKGYERTTVSEIAIRAGLTERTYFNYFQDKREVLFVAQGEFISAVVDAIVAAPAEQRDLDVALAALSADTGWYDTRREDARRRRRIIDAHADLREREAAKLAVLTTSMARALADRGASSEAATLTAATAVVAFQLASDNWLADAKKRTLGHHFDSVARELRRAAHLW